MALSCQALDTLKSSWKDLESTLNNIEADTVVLATPAKIEKLIKINKPITRASWELTIIEGPSVKELADEFLSRKGSKTI